MSIPGIMPGTFTLNVDKPGNRMLFEEMTASRTVRPLGQPTAGVWARDATQLAVELEHIQAHIGVVIRSVPDGALMAKDAVDPLCEVAAKLKQLSRLSAGWDGLGAPAPSATAVLAAADILRACAHGQLVPTGVVPSAEGGIGVTFRRGSLYADIECFNDGDILAAFDRGTGTPEVWPVGPDDRAIRAALDEIRVRLDS